MLVLSRKLREQIVIGQVVITVTSIKGSIVKIGIEAPGDITVRRGELKDKHKRTE